MNKKEKIDIKKGPKSIDFGPFLFIELLNFLLSDFNII